jgi:PAS domain S-box-containing protein
MNRRFDNRFKPYGFSVLATAIALLITLWQKTLFAPTPAVLFFIAIILSNWYGGLRSGLLAAVLSTLAINYFFIPPLFVFTLASPSEAVRLGIFILVAFIVNLLSSNLRRSKRQVEQLDRELLEVTQKSAEQLRLALTAARMGMWNWNLLSGEINWSPEHEQLFGLAPGTFDGRYETFDERIHPDDREALAIAVNRAIQERKIYQHEYRVVWTDGSIHWIEGRGQAFYDETGQAVRMTGTIMDISERKLAQAVLQEREAILRLFAQYAPAGIAMLDRDMRYMIASQRWIDEYNLDSIESLINRSHYEIFPEIPERWRQIHQRCLAGAIEKCDDDLFVRADGTEQWISWEIHPWYTATDEIGGIIIFTVDVTKRKLAETALLKLNAELEQRVAARTAELTQVNDRLLETVREQQYTQLILLEQSQLLDLAHDTIMTCDLNGIITFWNEGAQQMYGWTKAEALGQQTHTFLQTQFPKPLVEIESELRERGYWEGELIHTRRDGSTITVASRWVMQKDEMGRLVKVLEINNDISDRKQVEATLRETERRWRYLLENVRLVVVGLDITGKVEFANAFFLELTGYTQAEVLSKDWFETFLPLQEQQQVHTAFQEILEHEFHPHYTNAILTKSGEERIIAWNNTQLRNLQDEVIGTMSIGEDITERHAVEKMKNEFISIVSHELRTPLTSIRGSLGILATGALNNHPERMRRMIEIAAIDTERLVRLVNDILDLERLESGRVTLVKECCNAVALMVQAAEAMRSLAEKENITLSVSPIPTLVWASPDHIIQTLTNLLSNAIKFSPANSTITLIAEPLGDCVLFQVKDQGRGIPVDKLDTIFGRFQQVDASDSRSKGGTGLGLAICQSIITQHGGRIWVESVLGEGSTFYFTLPITPQQA